MAFVSRIICVVQEYDGKDIRVYILEEKILYLALKIMLLSYLTPKLKIFLICP